MASLYSSRCLIRHTARHLCASVNCPKAPIAQTLWRAPLVKATRTSPPAAAYSSTALARASDKSQSTRTLVDDLPPGLIELFEALPSGSIDQFTPLELAGASEISLPTPKTTIPVEGKVYVPSDSNPDKSYCIHHFSQNAYSCNCMAWTVSKGRAIDNRTCKHLREVLGDEHENVRVGPGVGVAKGKPKSKGKGKAPATSSEATTSAIASTSKSAFKEAASAEGAKRYAEPGAKKRPIAPLGRKAAAAQEDELDQLDEGEAAQPAAKKKKEREGGIELLLAKKLDLVDKTKKDPTGWWMSEKLDGVRAYWDGESAMWSRVGNKFSAPQHFLDKLPKGHELDGELFLGRDRFDETSGIVRSIQSTRWNEIRYMVFDIPSRGNETFEARQRFLEQLFPRASPSTPTSPSAAEVNPASDSETAGSKEGSGFIRAVEQEKCKGWDHVEERLAQVKRLGGEGLMLRQPGSKYENKRSNTLLKVKTFYDAEARVVGHEPGKGRLAGSLGSLVCVMEDEKTEFKVGSGFDDARRAKPPPIGAIVTYRFQDLTKAGVPRFPTFVGERFDVTGPKDAVLDEKEVENE